MENAPVVDLRHLRRCGDAEVHRETDGPGRGCLDTLYSLLYRPLWRSCILLLKSASRNDYRRRIGRGYSFLSLE